MVSMLKKGVNYPISISGDKAVVIYGATNANVKALAIEIIEIELCIHISIDYTTIQILLDSNNKNGSRYRRKLINVAVIT